MNRKILLGYPFKLQLLAEPGESAGTEIDNDKFAEIIEKRIKSTENKV